MDDKPRNMFSGKPRTVVLVPPYLFGSFVLAGVVLDFAFPLPFLGPNAAFIGGLVLLLASGLLARAALRAMKEEKTSINVYRATTVLVTSGPFRYSRNPIYVSLALLYLAVSAFLNSLWLVALFFPLMGVVTCGLIRKEERYLEEIFGARYRNYKAKVRRWI